MELPKRISPSRDTQPESSDGRQELRENISDPNGSREEALGQNVDPQPGGSSTQDAEATLQLNGSYRHQGFYCFPLVHPFSHTGGWYGNDLQMTQVQLQPPQTYGHASYNQFPCQEYNSFNQSYLHGYNYQPQYVNYGVMCDTCLAMNLYNNQLYFQSQPHIYPYSSERMFSQINCNVPYLGHQEIQHSQAYQIQGDEGIAEAEVAEIHENGMTGASEETFDVTIENTAESLALSQDKVQIWLHDQIDDTNVHEKDTIKCSVVNNQDSQTATKLDHSAPEFKPRGRECCTPFEASLNSDSQNADFAKGKKDTLSKRKCCTGFQASANDDSEDEVHDEDKDVHFKKRTCTTLKTNSNENLDNEDLDKGLEEDYKKRTCTSFEASPKYSNSKDLAKGLEDNSKMRKECTTFEAPTNDYSYDKKLEKVMEEDPNQRKFCKLLKASQNEDANYNDYDKSLEGYTNKKKGCTSFEAPRNDDSYDTNLDKSQDDDSNKRKCGKSFKEFPNEISNTSDHDKSLEDHTKKRKGCTSFEAPTNDDSCDKNLDKIQDDESSKRKCGKSFKGFPNEISNTSDHDKSLEDHTKKRKGCTSFKVSTNDDFHDKTLDKDKEDRTKKETGCTSFEASTNDDSCDKSIDKGVKDHPSKRQYTSFKASPNEYSNRKDLDEELEEHTNKRTSSSLEASSNDDIEHKNLEKILENNDKRTENIKSCGQPKILSQEHEDPLQEQAVSLKLTYSEILKKHISKSSTLRLSNPLSENEKACTNEINSNEKWPSIQDVRRNCGAKQTPNPKHTSERLSRTLVKESVTEERPHLQDVASMLPNNVSEGKGFSKENVKCHFPRKPESNVHDYPKRVDLKKSTSVHSSKENNSKIQSEKDVSREVIQDQPARGPRSNQHIKSNGVFLRKSPNVISSCEDTNKVHSARHETKEATRMQRREDSKQDQLKEDTFEGSSSFSASRTGENNQQDQTKNDLLSTPTNVSEAKKDINKQTGERFGSSQNRSGEIRSEKSNVSEIETREQAKCALFSLPQHPCKWKGDAEQQIAHLRTVHPDMFMECDRVELKVNSVRVLFAYNTLFVIYTSFCLESDNLCCVVQLGCELKNSEDHFEYICELDSIPKFEIKVTRSVTPFKLNLSLDEGTWIRFDKAMLPFINEVIVRIRIVPYT